MPHNDSVPKTPPAKREVVGVFSDRERFESAVQALLKAGFDRSDLSVLASHESIDAAGEPPRRWQDVFAALVGEVKYEVPLVASGAVFLAGGAAAAAIAGLIGATVGGLALKEVLDEAAASPHTEDFERALKTGSAVLWVQISHGEKEDTVTRILQEYGAANVHTLGG